MNLQVFFDISRDQDEETAQAEAESLSGLEEITSSLPRPFDVDTLIAEAGAAIDAEHNFDHLLRPER